MSTRDTKKEEQKKTASSNIPIVVAVITVLGTIITAMLTTFKDPLVGLIFKTPTAAATAAPTSAALASPTNEANVLPSPISYPSVIKDDFDNGIGPLWQGDKSYWVGRNGLATIINAKRAKLLIGSPDWKDYTVEVNVTSSEYNFSSFLAGVIVRYQDEQDYAELIVNCDFPMGDISWVYYKNGMETIATNNEMLCQPYNIKIVVSGSAYSAYLNGTLESGFSNELFTHGLVGILSADNGGNGVAAFDNFSVSP